MDPPPIVELKILEGEEGDERDVTFSVTANYFLFSTLEQARNIAPGRGSQGQNQLTVLTGTPVAGMVYLDRPKPAGYFIFPDLSVRHEGKYRLSFSLYEELKDSKDEDKDSDPSKPNGAGDAHVTHRLEVKSVPFTVYSAKKFPGLTESTALSRMVAEQGCRVRIRRDVRMRRRDTKGGKDWEGYEEETAEARARLSATPESAAYQSMGHGYGDPISRPRSASNASHHSIPQPIVSRRTSLHEMQGYHNHSSHGTAPHTPQTSYAHSSPYGPSPAQQYSQPPYMQQQPMQPPAPQYSQPTYQAAPPVPSAAPGPPQHTYYGYSAAPPPPSQIPQHQYGPPASTPARQAQIQQHQYGPPPPTYEPVSHPQRMSVDYSSQVALDHRRSSTHIPPPPQPSTSAQYPVQHQHTYQPAPPASSYQHSHDSSIGSTNSYGSRPAPAEPPIRPAGIATPLSARPSFTEKLPSINTQLPSISAKYLEPSSPASAIAPPGYASSIHTPVDSQKRGYSQVFNEAHLRNPLRQGARPSDAGYSHVQSGATGFAHATEADDNEDEPEFDLASGKMHYKRASGMTIWREYPTASRG